MPGISRDPDKARRQLDQLAANNPRLAARLKAGELPGFKGPLEGTEHLHPEAAAAAPAPTPAAPADAGHVPGVSPAPEPAPVDARHVPGASPASRVEVGTYEEPHAPTPPEPATDDEPGGGDPEPELEPAAAPERRRGALGELADGFLGRL